MSLVARTCDNCHAHCYYSLFVMIIFSILMVSRVVIVGSFCSYMTLEHAAVLRTFALIVSAQRCCAGNATVICHEEFLVSKGWFPYDRRRSRIAESSAIVCDHMETHFDPAIAGSYGNTLLRSCDRRRLQTIAEDRTMFYLMRSSAIMCNRLRSCDHMETKVLRSAIEMYPIIFLILTDDSTFLSHKARMFDYSNAHLL